MTVRIRTAARRFARLFAAAVDQLGDNRQSQRVGALHTLALLGQDAPAHRPAIVDVFCAYLRGAGTDTAVRLAATRLLGAQLRPGRSGFWPGQSLDLTGAVLDELDLSDCRVDGRLRLDGAVLRGPTRMRGMIVGDEATMRGSQWEEHAWLERTVFQGPVSFDGATFHGDAWFGEAMFGGWTSFTGTDFGGHAWFGGASFGAPVDFGHALFRRSAGFRGAVVHAGVGLGGTTFLGPARVSRRGDGWNFSAPGWMVVVDDDNQSVGRLLWIGHPELVEKPAVLDRSEPTPV
jgi:Pentapeptide repeats (9 copies)